MLKYFNFTECSQRAAAVRKLIEKYCDLDARILELGCGCGRDLANLYDLGYRNLVGIEINPHAVAIMRDSYTDAFNCSEVFCGRIETLLPKLNNDFDVIYTFIVLQYIEPSDIRAVVRSIVKRCKICITIENEHKSNQDHLWTHDYSKLFSLNGAVELENIILKTDEPYHGIYTIRVFDCEGIK